MKNKNAVNDDDEKVEHLQPTTRRIETKKKREGKTFKRIKQATAAAYNNDNSNSNNQRQLS